LIKILIILLAVMVLPLTTSYGLVAFTTITSDKINYTYEDDVTLRIKTSFPFAIDVTISIFDEDGKIIYSTNMTIDDHTTITLEKPFDKTLHKKGMYLVVLENDAKAENEFYLVNEGEIIITKVFKNEALEWSKSSDPFDDLYFSYVLYRLIRNENISIPGFLPSEPMLVDEDLPEWLKYNCRWWADGLISDKEFVNGIAYLASKKIIEII